MSAEPDRSHQKPPFLKRVRIRNYKSIKFCDVELEPLTVLVGRNGSGKSNFIDALGFLRDVVFFGVKHAIGMHGGRDSVLRRAVQNPVVELEIETRSEIDDDEWLGVYHILIYLPKSKPATIIKETFQLRSGSRWVGFIRGETDITFSADHEEDLTHSCGEADKPSLFWYRDSPVPEFVDALEAVQLHSFQPEAIRALATPQSDTELDRSGKNAASVFADIAQHPELATRLVGYLSAINDQIASVAPIRYGEYETVRFTVGQRGTAKSHEFDAASMSDGTLRAFAALVAVFQQTSQGPPSLVAIEEPETSLHPAATAALVDALDEATGRTQILITTHSTELLDNPTIQPRNVRVVEMIDGETVITSVNAASVKNVVEGLNTLGGLERENRLKLNLAELKAVREAETGIGP